MQQNLICAVDRLSLVLDFKHQEMWLINGNEKKIPTDRGFPKKKERRVRYGWSNLTLTKSLADYFVYNWLIFYQFTSKKKCKSPGTFKDWSTNCFALWWCINPNHRCFDNDKKKRTNKEHTAEILDLCKAFCTNNDLGALYLRVREKQTLPCSAWGEKVWCWYRLINENNLLHFIIFKGEQNKYDLLMISSKQS